VCEQLVSCILLSFYLTNLSDPQVVCMAMHMRTHFNVHSMTVAVVVRAMYTEEGRVLFSH
jgi:hypothetical protein